MTTPLLEAREVWFAYDEAPALREVSLALRPGELVGLIGPNGSGKSTLLKVLLGLLRPATGEVLVEGRPLVSLRRRDIARRLAFVPQDTALQFSYTVEDIVAMGRLPYLGRFRAPGAADARAVEEALAATETALFRGRFVHELSGGERQRVLIARALAQQTPVVLLDEPTANLDLAHQLEVLRMIRTLSTGEGKAAVASLHDLNLAGRFCDRLVLLSEGRVAADGLPADLLTVENLRRHFNIEARVTWDQETAAPAITPLAPLRPSVPPEG